MGVGVVFQMGVVPHAGVLVLMGGGGSKKIVGWGGGCPPPCPHPTMGNPVMGGLNLKICQNFVGTKFFHMFVGGGGGGA